VKNPDRVFRELAALYELNRGLKRYRISADPAPRYEEPEKTRDRGSVQPPRQASENSTNSRN